MRYFITIYILLFSILLCQDNPWVLTTEEKPTSDAKYLISTGGGPGGLGSGTVISFKYGFFTPNGKNSLKGYSFSGYSQSYSGYTSIWGGDYFSQKQTSFLFSYSYMKAFNETHFSGPFWGYDVGMNYLVDDEHPLGITLDMVEAFFDDEKRSKIGLGVVLSLGYKMKMFITSFNIGFDMRGHEDFLFFLDDEDDIDFDVNHSFTTFNFGLIF